MLVLRNWRCKASFEIRQKIRPLETIESFTPTFFEFLHFLVIRAKRIISQIHNRTIIFSNNSRFQPNDAYNKINGRPKNLHPNVLFV